MATATLISYPSALCLAGNIEPVRVSAAGLFTFRLKRGSTVLLEEDYVPDSSGQAEIDIRDIILSDLSLSLPTSDVYKQASAAGSYTITTDTDSKAFKAVLGGIERPATDTATFLQANFLTWQPQIKSVTYDQPEWLSFYTPATAIALKAKFYLKDGTTDTVTVAGSTSFDADCIYSVNVQFARLWNMGEGDRYGMVDVWLEDDQGTALTYVQRYVLDTSGDERTVLVARNSLGGIDTFSFRGSMERTAEVEHTNVMRGETLCSGLLDLTRTYTVNTGILSRYERDWVWDLQRSPQAWALMDGALLPVVMLAPAVTASMYEDSTGTVDFYISDDSGYLNIPRVDAMPADIEIPGPDGEVFFLAPRLIDFQDAVLDQSLLIPVQSPLLQEWRKMSVGSLSSYLLSLVDDKYQSSIHVHDNFSVLSRLSVDENGRLLFDGGLVGGGSGLTEHDHHGETIRPEKIIIGDVEITCTDGRLHVSKGIVSDGDLAAFGAEEAEDGGSGGLDVDRLWDELRADDSSKVIDVSHLPSDVVLQDELTAALLPYAKTTDLNSALADYAKSDWVAEQLSMYLLLTGGKISGDLEVTGSLTVGEAVITYSDGQLHISKTVVSEGDLAAFGAASGSTSGGGLDVDRLWDELRADDSSKVIDVSHLPELASLSGDLPWPRISGVPSWIGSSKPSYTWSEIAGKPDSFTPSAHSHPLSQISGLNSTWAGLLDDAPTAYVTRWPAFSEVTGKPSSLSGYGIEDGVNDVTITGAGNAVTTASVSGHMLTLTKGSSFSLSSHLHDSRYLMLDGGGTVDGSVKVTGSLTVGEAVITYSDGQLHISKTVVSEGDLAAFGAASGSTSGGGLDVDRLWDELRADDSSKVIDVSHLPELASLSGDLDESRISGLSATLSSYAFKSGNNASGTWPINVTGNAGSSDISNYLYLNPANNTLTSENDAVPTNGRFGVYNVNTATSAGGSDGYIMAFRWRSDNWVSQVYIDVNPTGIMALRHRSSSNVWSEWYRILHSGNFSSYLDSRYARQTYINNFIVDNNEFNFIPSGFAGVSGGELWLNYKTQGGANGGIQKYIFGNGANSYNVTLVAAAFTGNAASATYAEWLSTHPANNTLTSENDAVPTNGRFGVYNVNTATSAGGSDGYIMAFRWRSDNWVSQVYIDVNPTGIMALRHRSSSNVWSEWYQILHSGNFSSYLDSRYIKKAGDSMTGVLSLPRMKTTAICIECDSSGNTYRSHEINDYTSHLYLQYDSPNNVVLNRGGGNTGIGLNPSGHRLHVGGDIYATTDISVGGRLYVPSVDGNQVYDIYIA